jgi:hypothetical protein
LKAGESGCKPLWSWDFCWRTGFGVNPIAEWPKWPKVGLGNAIFSQFGFARIGQFILTHLSADQT